LVESLEHIGDAEADRDNNVSSSSGSCVVNTAGEQEHRPLSSWRKCGED
jgi:hypothetical protein